MGQRPHPFHFRPPRLAAAKSLFCFNLLTVVVLAGVLIFTACKKEKQPATQPPQPLSGAALRYAGSYTISPPLGGSVLELRADGTAAYRSKDMVFGGSFQVSEQTLRVFITPSRDGPIRVAPIGVFLLSNYDPRGWRGFWDDEVVFLIRAAR